MLEDTEIRDALYDSFDEQLCQLLRIDESLSASTLDFSTIKWGGIATNANSLGMGPLLYARLRQSGRLSEVPAETVQILKSSYLGSVAASMKRRHELKKILQGFELAGIRVMVLKGAHLAETAYPDPGLRPMSDMDLLVPEKALEQAAVLIGSLGYQPNRKYWTDFETTVHIHLPPFSNAQGQVIEIHFSFFLESWKYQVDLEQVWGRAQSFPFEGMQAWGLSVEDLLLHLAIHSAIQHHLNGCLRQIYDCAAVVDRMGQDINWTFLAELAVRCKAQRPLFLVLLLSKELFGAAVPQEFLDEVRPSDFDPALTQVAKELLFIHQEETQALSINYASVMRARTLPGKVLSLMKQVFISPEAMAQEYAVKPGSPRILLYYPVRLKYLVIKHAGSIKRLLAGDPDTVRSAEISALRQDRIEYLIHQLSEN